MNRPEDNILHWEKVGWNNYGRWKQVKDIFDQFLNSNIDGYMRFINTLNEISVKGLPTQASDRDFELNELVDAVKNGVRTNQISSVIHELETNLFDGATGTKEVPLDMYRPIMFAGIKLSPNGAGVIGTLGMDTFLLQMFPTAAYNLGYAISEGKNEAVREILGIFQGSSELIPYRRDLLGSTKGQQTLNGGEMFTFPTKVDGLQVKLVYEKEARIPAVNLVLNPLS